MFEQQRLVEFRDTDAAGIVHFSVFLVWMEQAEHAALRSLGMSVMATEHVAVEGTAPVTWPRVSARCDYLRPVRFEDMVTIRLGIEKLGHKSVVYRAEFSCREQLVAVGVMTTVCCELGADSALRSVAIPETIQQRLSRLLLPPPDRSTAAASGAG